MPDVNLHSFVGPADNGRHVDFTGEVVDASGGYASALKCSVGVTGLTITADQVIGGHDACVDVNNGADDTLVVIEEAVPTGQFLMTNKGGARGTSLIVKRLVGHGKVCDVMYDDWSDQSHKITRGNRLNVTSADGSPVTVRLMGAEMPVLFPNTGPYKFLFPWPWLGWPARRFVEWCFCTLRRWGFWRFESIPSNTPAPAVPPLTTA